MRDLNHKKQLKTLALEKITQIMDSLSNESKVRYHVAIKEFAELYLEDEVVFQELYYAYKEGLSSYTIPSTEGEVIYYRREEGEHGIQFEKKILPTTRRAFLPPCYVLH
ncbi:hypothetical protein [Bacillus sp. B1-b2]|uniref:hypothetical protein n=1 Tax=Bacillus sp. B1-b2 TaxID=2653201 RepID=UPI001261DB17|nr:hypothetical protein [Bacillus sp. B1-b2]KAB7667702.1 hypothetical protein F9279_14315 [Bacillus sp. B1-b2]